MKWESRAEVFKVVGGVEEQVGEVCLTGVDQLGVDGVVEPQEMASFPLSSSRNMPIGPCTASHLS